MDCRAAWSTCRETCPAPASCCAGLIRTLCEPGTAAKDEDAEEGDEVPEAEAEQGPTSSREAWCSVTTGAPCTAGRGTHAAARLRGLARRRHKFVCGSLSENSGARRQRPNGPPIPVPVGSGVLQHQLGGVGPVLQPRS